LSFERTTPVKARESIFLSGGDTVSITGIYTPVEMQHINGYSLFCRKERSYPLRLGIRLFTMLVQLLLSLVMLAVLPVQLQVIAWIPILQRSSIKDLRG